MDYTDRFSNQCSGTGYHEFIFLRGDMIFAEDFQKLLQINSISPLKKNDLMVRQSEKKLIEAPRTKLYKGLHEAVPLLRGPATKPFFSIRSDLLDGELHVL